MKFDYVVITDHGYINGGLASVAIGQAIGLHHSGYSVLFLSGTEEIDGRLKSSGVFVETIGRGDFFSAYSRISGIVNGIFSASIYSSIKSVVARHDLLGAKILVHGWSKCLSPSIFFALRDKSLHVYIWNHDYFMFCPNGGFFNYKVRSICRVSPGGIRCLSTNCDSRNFYIKVFRYVRFKIMLLSGVKRYAKKFISISELNSRVIESHVHNNCVAMIENFIEYPGISAATPARFDSLVVVGRPSPEKGLIELFHFLQKAKISRKILIIGASEDDYRDVDFGGLNVNFTGWIGKDKVTEMMSESRFMIFPSLWYEGAPLVVQDAIAMGLPVLCADVNAGAEAVRKHGAGAIYDPYDYSSFEIAYRKLDDDDFLVSCSQCSYNMFWKSPPTLRKHIESVSSL